MIDEVAEELSRVRNISKVAIGGRIWEVCTYAHKLLDLALLHALLELALLGL